MQKSKNRIKILLIIGLLFISFFIFTFIFFKNSNKIKLGMDKEDVLSILEKDKYRYEINGSNDEPIIFVYDVIFNDIEGNLFVHINSRNRVSRVCFSSSTESLHKKIDVLMKYLTKLYNEPIYNEEFSDLISAKYYNFYKNNMVVNLEYPTDSNDSLNSINVGWSYKNDNEEQ